MEDTTEMYTNISENNTREYNNTTTTSQYTLPDTVEFYTNISVTTTREYNNTTTTVQYATSSITMWFETSIALIVTLVVVLLLFLVWSVRERRLLRKSEARSINKFSDSFYINECSENNERIYMSPSSENKTQDVVAKSQDVRVQVTDEFASRPQHANRESGFESFSGSIVDHRRNMYESIGSVEGSLRGDCNNTSDYDGHCSVVHEKQAIFQHQQRISEEESLKEETEFQKHESSTITPPLSAILSEITEAKDKVNCVKPENYMNVLLHNEKDINSSDTCINAEKGDVPYINVDNPMYGLVKYDEKNEHSLHTENIKDLYQNTGDLRNQYMIKLHSQSSPSVLSFLNLEWDYKSVVDSNGGLVKAPNSDISLILPINFITDSPATVLFWSVFAQDCDIESKTDLDSYIVSPVVEYYTPYKNKFAEYVIMEIPHCISEYSDDMVQPYWFYPTVTTSNGKFQIHKIPRICEEDFREYCNLPDVFFVKNRSGFVSIYSTHFSVYFCACDQSFPLELYAVTFGKYVPIDNSQVNIKIKVHIADVKITLKDCLEALKQEEQSLGYTYKGKTEIDLDNDVDRTDSIEINVDFEDVPRNMNPIWKHSVDKDGYPIHPVSKSWQIANRFKCGGHKFVQTTKEWQFKNESPPRYRTVFQCFIEILYRKCLEQSSVERSSMEAEISSPSTTQYKAMGHNDIEYDKKHQESTLLKSPPMRTRMTVDIDLSDTVVECEEIGRGLSRESILPNIIYELIDGMDDEKFDEMCRRLGADRELRSLKRSDDSITRGKKYELLANIRDVMSGGKFCTEVTTVLVIMKENILRQAILEHIKKATLRNSHFYVNVEPQSTSSQRLVAVQHNDDETFLPYLDHAQNEETREKVVQ